MSNTGTATEPANPVAGQEISKDGVILGSKDRVSFDGADDDYGEEARYRDLGATGADKREMTRMGKVQELRRNFRPLSTFSFVVIVQGTWVVLITANTAGLQNGGTAGLVWSYVWTFVGMGFINVSLAEMSSMAPTSGGQYHWVSEFAPPKYQRVLSFITGWLSVLAWQAGTASGPFVAGLVTQSLAVINYPSYEPTAWQGTMMVWAATLIMFLVNAYAVKFMPIFQNIMLLVYTFSFLAAIIVFWTLAPLNSAETVFTVFTNSGGWSSTGLSLMVGQVSAIFGLTCTDSAAHMAEETKDAGTSVPKAMLRSYVLNAIIGFIFIITYAFAMTSIDDALEEPNGYPFLWVLQQAVSVAGVNGLTAIIVFVNFAGILSYSLSTSRQLWAFARDKGVPLHTWIAKVDQRFYTPINAVGVTCGITVLLSLINIGSDVAFNAVISLNLVSIMLTYTISIGCVLYRRIYQPELLPPARWSLGRWGVFANAGGVAYSLFAFFWCFWPSETPVVLETFNWACVMFVAVIVFATVDYLLRGRRQYKGPVTLVEGWKDQ